MVSVPSLYIYSLINKLGLLESASLTLNSPTQKETSQCFSYIITGTCYVPGLPSLHTYTFYAKRSQSAGSRQWPCPTLVILEDPLPYFGG